MAKRVVFSGIQPSGDLHLGNYIGAVRRWVAGQTEGLNIFCIVDMHAITVEHDPIKLKESSLDLAALLLAAGIKAETSILFVQSQNYDHANLAWILNCNLSMGQMNRMTQFKEKSEKKDFVSVGLFDYPALMAADILLYDTTHVPVGDDQKQHVELARDIAQRFNSRYGEVFSLPEAVIPETGGRIMSLQDPTKKMSKSDPNPNSRIELLDDEATINKKFRMAVTDNENLIKYDKNRPGIKNLIDIYKWATTHSIEKIETDFEGKGYGEFKEQVAIHVNTQLDNLRKEYTKKRNSDELKEILNKGAEKAREISSKKLKEVYDKVGFVG